MAEQRVAIIVGSTGLIGSLLLSELSHFDIIRAISRKSIQGLSQNIQNTVVNFQNSDELKSALVGTDLFFCLGTTLKTAGSKEKFIEIEWELSKRILEIAARNGVENLYLISSMGADAKSAILYSKIKGQIENLVKDLGFKSVTILRPSLLLGNRHEHRAVEAIAQSVLKPIGFLFKGPLLKYRAIDAQLVAQRLAEKSLSPSRGVRIFENDQLFEGFKS